MVSVLVEMELQDLGRLLRLRPGVLVTGVGWGVIRSKVMIRLEGEELPPLPVDTLPVRGRWVFSAGCTELQVVDED